MYRNYNVQVVYKSEHTCKNIKDKYMGLRYWKDEKLKSFVYKCSHHLCVCVYVRETEKEREPKSKK